MLKERAGKVLPHKHRVLGIRWEESAGRSNRQMIDWHRNLKQHEYNPIIEWKEWEVWDFIDGHKLPYCSLYDEGFDRIGCVVCPQICSPNMAKVLMHKKRFPKHYKAFEKAMEYIYYKRIPKWKEKTFEEFLINWYRGR